MKTSGLGVLSIQEDTIFAFQSLLFEYGGCDKKMHHHNTNKTLASGISLCILFLTEKWESTLKATLEMVPKNNKTSTFIFVSCHAIELSIS